MIKFTKKMFDIIPTAETKAREYNICLGGVRLNKHGFATKKAAERFLGEYISLVNSVGAAIQEKKGRKK